MAADAQHIRHTIQAGRLALQRGDLAAARRCLADVDHPEAQYLLALTAQHQGDFDVAETAYRRALYLQPNLDQAADGLGRLFIDLERWDDAAKVYEELLDVAPAHLAGRFGLATAYLNRGELEIAEAIFDTLIDEGNDRPEIRFMRGRARLELGRVEEGFEDLKDAHQRAPGPLSLRAFAAALWMRGDREDFDALVAGAEKDPELFFIAAELLRQSGDPERAIDCIRNMVSGTPIPDAAVVLAHAQIDIEDAAAAEGTARSSLIAVPGHRGLVACLITALLMQGNATEALEVAGAMRRAEPERQHWIAYEATALRLLGDRRYEELVDLERFVKGYELPVPKGFDSLEDFNAAFLDALEKWHEFRHHPLDQTLRHGSQTSRDLVTIDEPVFRAYFRALDEPISAYMDSVGSSPSHPLTARNRHAYRIAGCWSVRLHGKGWHVNHVHPEGWISSAYYVSVPPEVDEGDGKAGWIKFGEPPFRTEPPTPAQKWVKPHAGLVVLFPSFLWHGTEAIGDGSVRVTAPFDVVPG